MAPAAAVVLAFLAVLKDAATEGALSGGDLVDDPVLQAQLGQLSAGLNLSVPSVPLARAVGGFGQLIGLITLELGGHFVGGFEPADALYANCVAELADLLGLADPAG